MSEPNISQEAREQTASVRRELTALSQITDLLEPLELDRRTQVIAAVMCLEYMECATAAIQAFQRRSR